MRIGIIGFGGIAGAHLPGWQRIRRETDDLEIHVYDVVPDRNAAAAQHDDVTVHETVESLIDAVDAVDICTPSDTHGDLIRQAARAGRHVICEKPIAMTVSDAIDAVRSCRDAGVQLHVGHVVRFFGEYAAAHAALVAGDIGDPAVLHYRRAGGQPRHNEWMQDEKRSGGLPLDLMIHDLDQARWTAGEVVRVYAQSAKQGRGDVTLHTYAILTHASGAISHVTSSWGLNHGFETSFEVAGSEGQVAFDSSDVSMLRTDKDGLLDSAGLLPVMMGDSPFYFELREFFGSLQGGPPPRVGPGDAVQALAIALAVRESIAAGGPVDVPPLPDDLADTVAVSAGSAVARGTW